MVEITRPGYTLIALFILFNLLGAVFYLGAIPKDLILLTLVFWSVVFLAVEVFLQKPDMETLRNAFGVGAFLMIFDFIVENSGWILHLWTVHGPLFQIGAVPLEILLVTLIGGAAWALYLPKKFDWRHSALDVLLFAIYGTLGEHLLRLSGIMVYEQWWGWPHAFVAYLLTWLLLHQFRYKAVEMWA